MSSTTEQAQALTRDWNNKTRVEQIIARHQVWGLSGLPNDEYTASYADVKELLDEREHLRRMLSTVIDANYGTSYHHIGDGDGIPHEQAKEIAEWWRLELEQVQRKYATRNEQGNQPDQNEE